MRLSPKIALAPQTLEMEGSQLAGWLEKVKNKTLPDIPAVVSVWADRLVSRSLLSPILQHAEWLSGKASSQWLEEDLAIPLRISVFREMQPISDITLHSGQFVFAGLLYQELARQKPTDAIKAAEIVHKEIVLACLAKDEKTSRKLNVRLVDLFARIDSESSYLLLRSLATSQTPSQSRAARLYMRFWSE